MLRVLRAAACLLVLAGCSPTYRLLSKTPPGDPVISMRSGVPNVTTNILANSMSLQSGIVGNVIDIGTNANGFPIDQMTLDYDGNLGLRGHFVGAMRHLERGEKRTVDPLSVLASAPVVVLGDDKAGAVGVAFVGSTPTIIAGRGTSSMDLSSSLAVTMAAVDELSKQVRDLRAQVNALKKNR